VALVASLAAALPLVGALRPEVQLTDAWDRSIQLSKYRGMPVLVVYEDKGSARQNEALKSELSVLAKGDRYRTLIALVAVADVTGYDYWPIRGFVRSAIRSESQKQGTVIYCDWDGRVRTALGLERGMSNIVLYGRDGTVLYARAGAMSGDERRTFLALLKAQVE
jgi:predicted transcriptional regulator